jgi:hypothetical protein
MPSPPVRENGGINMCGMAASQRMNRFVVGSTCFVLTAMPWSAQPVRGESQVQMVTSDTPEYCLQLLDKISEMVRVSPGSAPQEVMHLSNEGQRMCNQGQTLGGILRLRRALMLMLQRDTGP